MLTAIQAKIKSGHMYKFRQDNGLTIKEASAMADVSMNAWCNLEGLKFNRAGYGIAQKVAECIGCLPEDLIPKELAGKEINASAVAYKHFAAERLYALSTQKRLELPSPTDEIELEDKREGLKRILKTLTFRERTVIELRYGLNDEGAKYTLEEVGRIMKTTRERVRQVECKAIRKLQHPDRADLLKGLL